MKKQKIILITFDVEEFDTPLLHQISIDEEEQMNVSQQGLLRIMQMLNALKQPPCTFYTTANYAQHFPETIQEISQHHEIASHTFYHTRFEEEHILSSKKTLEKIIQKQVYGFRMPNMAEFNKELIQKAGYAYDSSVNPVWLPGKYNHFSTPLKPYSYHNTSEIPASAVPFIRFPLFWLSFKNLPLWLYIRLCNFTLGQTGFLNLYFHPWEFADISDYKIPSFITQPNGMDLIKKLKRLIVYYQNKGDVCFMKTHDYYKQFISEIK